LEVDLAPVRVPARVRHRHPLVDVEGPQPARPEPARLLAERAQPLHGFPGEAHWPRYPTEPVISSWIKRFSSTAYSIGSSLVKGSMKPFTIIVSASALVMPRLCK